MDYTGQLVLLTGTGWPVFYAVPEFLNTHTIYQKKLYFVDTTTDRTCIPTFTGTTGVAENP